MLHHSAFEFPGRGPGFVHHRTDISYHFMRPIVRIVLVQRKSTDLLHDVHMGLYIAGAFNPFLIRTTTGPVAFTSDCLYVGAGRILARYI